MRVFPKAALQWSGGKERFFSPTLHHKEYTMKRIPSWFVALLAVALVLGLVGGVMAEECKGKVKSTGDGKIVVTTADGKDVTIMVADTVPITLAGQKAKLTDLKKDAEVTVTCKKEGDKIVAEKIEVK